MASPPSPFIAHSRDRLVNTVLIARASVRASLAVPSLASMVYEYAITNKRGRRKKKKHKKTSEI